MSQLTTSQLLDLIDSDQLATEMATAGNDSGCALRLREIAPKQRVQLLLTERGLYEYLGPQVAETILQKLEAVGEQNPIVRRALKWLEPANGGLDFGSMTTLVMVDQLTQSGVFKVEEQTKINDLSLVNDDISASEVSAAMEARRNA